MLCSSSSAGSANGSQPAMLVVSQLTGKLVSQQAIEISSPHWRWIQCTDSRMWWRGTRDKRMHSRTDWQTDKRADRYPRYRDRQTDKQSTWGERLLSHTYVYAVDIYIYIVELFSGPMFAFLCVKSWSFIFRKSRPPCGKKRVSKTNRTQTEHIHNNKTYVKNWSKFQKFCCATYLWTRFQLILRPVLNTCNLLCFGFCFCWNHYFIVFSAKLQNLKTHEKEKTTLFVNTPMLTALVKMSVFFASLILRGFGNFQFFERCFWLVAKMKKRNNKIPKQKTTKRRNEDVKQKEI